MRKAFQFSLVCFLLLLPAMLFAQDIKLTGKVVDNNGETMPGVSIIVKGTNRGTITELNGTYIIQVKKGETLVFSSIGFKDQEIAVADQTEINVTLATDAIGLDELVVVGYGTQSKRTVTAAIAKVSGETLQSTPISSVGDGLKGKIAGVRVYTTNFTPGAEPTFLIRGGSTGQANNSNNDPLILVDGIERGMAGINPADIESIEVLKDAASSAIYGSRASNGVVLITTKKGKAGAPRITFEASWAYENTERMMEFLTADETVPFMREHLQYVPSANQKLYSNDQAYSSGNTNSSKFSTRYLEPGESIPEGWHSCPDPLDPSKTLIYEDNDWVKESYRPALWQNYYVGVEGGSDKFNYLASIGYLDDSGVAVGTDYSRISARSNISAKLAKNIKFNGNIDFSQTNSNEFADQYQVINRGLMTPRTQRKYYASDDEWNGTPTPGPNSSSPNALFYAYYNDNSKRVNRLGLNGSLDWEILKGWHVVGTASLFTNNSQLDRFHRKDPLASQRFSFFQMDDTQRKKFEAYTSYGNTFGNHSINAMVGYSYQMYNYKQVITRTSDHTSDKVTTLTAGPTLTRIDGNKTVDVNIGYFGRINYDYKQRYMLTLTFREDGSSRFLSGYQWGFFPGASAGWLMSDEPFMKNQKVISNLKWRVSYGQTGNNYVGLNEAVGLFGIGTNYEGGASIVPSQMPNTDLTWETTTQLDLGFDLGLVNNRIILGADYFNKITDGLLTDLTLPNTSGFSSVKTNLGTIRYRGFDAEITTRNIETKNFSWESKLTMTYVRNKILKLPDNGREKNRIGGYTTTMPDGSTYEWGGRAEGEPLGRMYGYKHKYVLATQEMVDNATPDNGSKGWDWTQGKYLSDKKKKAIGDMEWYDFDENGVINGKDYYELGNLLPHTTGGFNNTITWKGLTMNIYLDFALGHSVRNDYLQRLMRNFMGQNTAIPREILKCWNEGDDPYTAKYPKYIGNDADDVNNQFRADSDLFIQKGDYLCIREVSLSYAFPKNLLKKVGINGLTATLSGNNLHYFTGVYGLSPEMGSNNTYASGSYYPYPPIRRISLSFRLTL